MKSKERRFVWLSLLLAGALSMPGGTFVRADNEPAIQETNVADEKLSDNAMDELESFEEETDIHDAVSAQEEVTQEKLSENEIEEQEVLSDNSVSSSSVSSDAVSDKKTESENTISDIDVQKKVLDVILPTEIPCDMVLLGEERLKGVVRSRQFYMENKGFEDIRISIQGVCLGKNDEDYVISNVSVEDGIVQGKKNVWIYLRWEDENGNELDKPGIIMGDASSPGKGDVILKAPERNSKGEIQGENPQSKIYFSVFGDLNSDTGRVWEDAELELSLKWKMEELTSENASNLLDLPDELEIPEQSEDTDEPESISDNMDILEEEPSVSDNTDALREETSISGNTDVSEERSISDNMDMLEEHKSISDNKNAPERQEEIPDNVDPLNENENIGDLLHIQEPSDAILDNADKEDFLE